MNTSAVLIAQAQYLRMGVIQISVANLLIIALMVVALSLAIFLPFPHGHDRSEGESDVHQ